MVDHCKGCSLIDACKDGGPLQWLTIATIDQLLVRFLIMQGWRTITTVNHCNGHLDIGGLESELEALQWLTVAMVR